MLRRIGHWRGRRTFSQRRPPASEGDACDLDDGFIFLLGEQPWIYWGAETGSSRWNVYRGDLDVLRTGGDDSQQPGANPLAAAFCDLEEPALDDSFGFPRHGAAFYLVSGSLAGAETDLGNDSTGAPRPHANPCPP